MPSSPEVGGSFHWAPFADIFAWGVVSTNHCRECSPLRFRTMLCQGNISELEFWSLVNEQQVEEAGFQHRKIERERERETESESECHQLATKAERMSMRAGVEELCHTPIARHAQCPLQVKLKSAAKFLLWRERERE